jgi:hypothetical protein
MLTQSEKGAAFHALRARDGAFIILSPCDIGMTPLVAHMGFGALQLAPVIFSQSDNGAA